MIVTWLPFGRSSSPAGLCSSTTPSSSAAVVVRSRTRTLKPASSSAFVASVLGLVDHVGDLDGLRHRQVDRRALRDLLAGRRALVDDRARILVGLLLGDLADPQAGGLDRAARVVLGLAVDVRDRGLLLALGDGQRDGRAALDERATAGVVLITVPFLTVSENSCATFGLEAGVLELFLGVALRRADDARHRRLARAGGHPQVTTEPSSAASPGRGFCANTWSRGTSALVDRGRSAPRSRGSGGSATRRGRPPDHVRDVGLLRLEQEIGAERDRRDREQDQQPQPPAAAAGRPPR